MHLSLEPYTRALSIFSRTHEGRTLISKSGYFSKNGVAAAYSLSIFLVSVAPNLNPPKGLFMYSLYNIYTSL